MRKENSNIYVDSLRLHTNKKYAELSVLFTFSELLTDRQRLWYRFPKGHSKYLTDNRYDPFLAALLPLAMKMNSNLILNGSVSERLIINCRQITKIFSRWFDDMNPIDIKAKELIPSKSRSKAVGSFFTAGVDSFYTVLKNLNTYQNESRITHLLFVHGFDIEIDNKDLFGNVKNEISAISARLELKPIFVKTNLRRISDPYVRWGEEQHGAALASVALCLSKLFKITYIPSSTPYALLFDWGSHPLVDPLWSNGDMQFIHDGNEANRSQKILWELYKSDVALKHLRVCWKNPDNSYNCGTCGKCLRTKIDLKLAGVLEQCQTLDNEINLQKYKSIIKHNYVERHMLAETISSIDDSPDNNQFKEKLYSVYDTTKGNHNRFRKSFRKIRSLARKYF